MNSLGFIFFYLHKSFGEEKECVIINYHDGIKYMKMSSKIKTEEGFYSIMLICGVIE